MKTNTHNTLLNLISILLSLGYLIAMPAYSVYLPINTDMNRYAKTMTSPGVIEKLDSNLKGVDAKGIREWLLRNNAHTHHPLQFFSQNTIVLWYLLGRGFPAGEISGNDELETAFSYVMAGIIESIIDNDEALYNLLLSALSNNRIAYFRLMLPMVLREMNSRHLQSLNSLEGLEHTQPVRVTNILDRLLQAAVDHNNTEAATILLGSGARYSSSVDTRQSLLMTATARHYSDMVLLLLGNRERLNARTIARAVDIRGRTALHLISEDAFRDSSESDVTIHRRDALIIGTLIRAGADINAVDSEGNSPLHAAAGNGDIQENIIRILLDNDADSGLRNNRGFTALDIARQNGSEEIIKALEKTSNSVNLPDGSNTNSTDGTRAVPNLYVDFPLLPEGNPTSE